ncbi:hypothetical protein USDA257_c32050 [Sinorhizobium fredii USDA 257]|uniref:ABM domain-containing protein n=2 Tax=Rhizobium fredii TaxID=380 RepID=I3X7B7_SINF2|nr:hypothetical protein USDA257_c32050 [Sinorhizobium fredii USDA 257]
MQRDTVSDRGSIMIENRLTILNLYELKKTPADFEIAVGALARRVEAEGHPGVLSYRFFVNASERTARGVIDYNDPDAWIGHHDIAMRWPEMTVLHAAATLAEVIFLGPLTSEIQAWIESSALTARVRSGSIFAGGFQRLSGWSNE